ncbi:MAG: FmdB family zinc ribbon protein [Desulfovibrionales bacterium]
MYEFQCTGCKKTFSETMPVAEVGTRTVSCPHCGSSQVEQVISSVYTKTSRKS